MKGSIQMGINHVAEDDGNVIVNNQRDSGAISFNN
jgi:hypothetical protein